MKKLKPDRKYIVSGKKRNILDFTNKEVILSDADLFFTDGIIDQNNPQRKRFSSKKVLDIINREIDKDFYQQKIIIENELSCSSKMNSNEMI